MPRFGMSGSQPGVGGDRRKQECPRLFHPLPEVLALTQCVADVPVASHDRDDLRPDRSRIHAVSQ